jgi:hypothetical protein
MSLPDWRWAVYRQHEDGHSFPVYWNLNPALAAATARRANRIEEMVGMFYPLPDKVHYHAEPYLWSALEPNIDEEGDEWIKI